VAERWHETTVDGVTAWASEWKTSENGSVSCWILMEDPSPFHQPAYVTYWPREFGENRMVHMICAFMTQAETVVSIELLEEARKLANG
jgi:hypothetical protein